VFHVKHLEFASSHAEFRDRHMFHVKHNAIPINRSLLRYSALQAEVVGRVVVTCPEPP
jgi:hypothetical protein